MESKLSMEEWEDRFTRDKTRNFFSALAVH